LRPETAESPATRAEYLGDIISPISGGRVPRHVAIIMDGNGRWAKERGLPRAAGHRAGAENIRRVIERFQDHGIEYLTVYAFSTENWRRPPTEVNAIIRLLDRFIRRELENLDQNGVRLQHLGHIETLPELLQSRVRNAIERTAGNDRLVLNICFSYGGRDELVMAVRRLIGEGVDADEVDEAAIAARLFTGGMPDPDMVIRTGGDTRISNFLLWQCAYSELYFTNAYWPDFGREDIDIALAEYGRRKRRFGGLSDTDDSGDE
jgi:undecaprenyl diphosphate synthase